MGDAPPDDQDARIPKSVRRHYTELFLYFVIVFRLYLTKDSRVFYILSPWQVCLH